MQKINDVIRLDLKSILLIKLLTMKKISFLFALSLFIVSCSNTAKNKNKEDIKDEVMDTSYDPEGVAIQPALHQEILGYWVGDFIADEDNKTNRLNEVTDYQSLRKKISLSIDSIIGEKVFGHSLVSGLQRSFTGTFELENDIYSFRVKEPGTNKYDGTFDFKIKNNKLSGNWVANNALKISVRKYDLAKRKFEYYAGNMFNENSQYVNENDTKVHKYTEDHDGEINEYTEELYVASTSKITEINASSTALTKEDVENLKKVDIMIIRNSIYARHGFSFNDPNLRSFFESQEWYMPVSTNIQKDLTKIEKANIKLLMQYEKIAEQNYDSFGR